MIILDGYSLSIEDFIKVSRNFEKACLSQESIDRMNKSRAFIESAVNNREVVYGVTTGFGDLWDKFIEPEKTSELSHNIIKSHSTGVGEPFNEEIARGTMLLRINTFAKGFSGIRLCVVEKLLELLNKRVYPYIPSQGSVGSSGDLAPLSHLSLVLLGEGECILDSKRVSSKIVLDKLNIEPVTLKSKEGLSLTNGTPVMTSIGCFTIYDAENLIKHAQIAGAMCLEALKGVRTAFDEKVHMVRPHNGQMKVADNLRKLIKNSEILEKYKNLRVQDAYSVRCMPQVFGGMIDGMQYIRGVLTVEMNSATDNPLIFEKERQVISGGNFHGEPIALVMDFLGILLSEMANISERLTDRLVHPGKSGLPPFLVRESGLNSGFMIPQYTSASLVSENKVLAHPASVDSIPTSGNQEDHVSMGTIAARHAMEILKNTTNVIAIELMTAAQGLDFVDEKPGIGTTEAHKVIRKHVTFVEKDRIFYKDIDAIRDLINSRQIVDAVESVVNLD